MSPNADRSLIGLSGPAFTVPVEPGKVRDYARATYSGHPDYLTGDPPIMPATFLGSAGWAFGYTLERPGNTVLRRAGLENANTLDAELGFSFNGPPPAAGTTLSATTRIADVFEKRGSRAGRMLFFKAATDFRDGYGRTIAGFETTSVLPEHISAAQIAGLVPPAERPSFEHDHGAELMAAIRPARSRDLSVGSSPGKIAFPPLTVTEIVRYQGATNDYNLIHHDENYARAYGYPSIMSVGLLHLGALMTYATNWLGPRNVRRIKARVLGIAWPGDRLRYSGTISRVFEQDSEQLADLTLSCSRQTGERTLDVVATFVVPD